MNPKTQTPIPSIDYLLAKLLIFDQMLMLTDISKRHTIFQLPTFKILEQL